MCRFPEKNNHVDSVQSKAIVISFLKPCLRAIKLALKGPPTPTGEGFRSINVRIRKEFNLFAIAGQHMANPTALLLPSAMMAHHCDVNLIGDLSDEMQLLKCSQWQAPGRTISCGHLYHQVRHCADKNLQRGNNTKKLIESIVRRDPNK